MHMQARVVREVGRHSWEQSPLALLHRLIPPEHTRSVNNKDNELSHGLTEKIGKGMYLLKMPIEYI